MEGIITTEIKFLESSQTMSTPQTGDIFNILALLLFVCAAVLAFIFIRRYLTSNSTSASGFGAYILNNKKISIASVAVILCAIIFLITGLTLNANARVGLADELSGNGCVQASNSVNAYVNTETGEINIEDGILKNTDENYPAYINKTDLKSNVDVADSVWTISAEEEVLYADKVNNEKSNNLKIDKNSKKIVKYKVAGLDLNHAKSLIGQSVAVANFSYKLDASQIDIKGKINISQSSLRPIDLTQNEVYFSDNLEHVYTGKISEDGTYCIENVPYKSTGAISTSIIGCAAKDSEQQNLHNHKIVVDTPLTQSLEGIDINYEQPNFDSYTLPELQVVSQDLNKNKESSYYYNEFTSYLNNDAVWWSNSDSRQDASCTPEAPNNVNVSLCNQDYRCHFDTCDGDIHGAADEKNQFVFLRIIGILQDNLSDGSGNAGLTLQAISALPNVYQYGPYNDSDEYSGWEPEHSFGKYWGDANCQLRAEMNTDSGSVYKGLADTFKEKVVTVDKKTQRTHKWPNKNLDVQTTQDKFFVTSYTEMCTPGSEYPGFKDFPWYFNSAEGRQYTWYKNQGISGQAGNEKIMNMAKLNNGHQIQFGFNPWIRTAYHKTDINFLYVDSKDGSFYKDNSYENAFSVVLTFCL